MSDEDGLDAIIIGAGITGLALATRLAAEGLSIRVLEARDRVGGRLLSVASNDAHPLDLGASWFWADEARVHELVARLGVRVHPQHTAGDALFQTTAGVQRLHGNPIDAPAMRLQDGAQSVALALAAPLGSTIRLDAPVEAVTVVDTTDGRRVDVRHRDGTLRARCVVIALPPALAVARIRFDPPLPTDIAALAARTPVWMGAITKAVAEYDDPFWRELGLAGAAVSHTGPLRELHDLSGPSGRPAALFGFAAPGDGPISPAAVLAQLVELFGERARTPRALHLHDWRREEWTSPADVEQHTDYATYGDPRWRSAMHERLWLASTETGQDHPGHIEGALAAAEHVGDALCSFIRAAP